MTTSTFGFGGPVNIMYIVDENGTIAKFKVLSHNETEYYGEVVAQSSYTGGFAGQELGSISDDVLVISGCTFTTNAVKTAADDVSAAFNAVKEAQ